MPPHFMREEMRLIDVVHHYSFAIPWGTTFHIATRIFQAEAWRLELGPNYFVLFYAILLALLKYRAAHHRKIRRWQKFRNDIDSKSKCWVYVKELFHLEAKMAPTSDPLLSELCRALYYIIVWVLFPPQVALVSLVTGMWFSLAHMLMVCHSVINDVHRDNLVYNGRRYRLALTEIRYIKIQDEGENVLYYPATDVQGLIPLESEWTRGV
jgi:hypothetical protein